MRSCLLVFALMCAPAAAAQAPAAGTYLVAASTTAVGAAGGALLATTAGLPLYYASESALGSVGRAGAGLLVLLAMPISSGLGAAVFVAEFAPGLAPILVGASVGAGALLAFIIATAAIANVVPETPEQQLGVAMVYVAPAVTAAAIGAVLGALSVPRPDEESG